MHYAGKHAYVQAGMHICRQACIDASSSYKQACFYAILEGMHSCGQACIYAGTHAYMQAGIHICRQACTYAGRSYEQACFYAILVRMHACMHACKQSAYMQASMHIYMQAGMHICRMLLYLSAVNWGCPRLTGDVRGKKCKRYRRELFFFIC